jgi:hypothetical protein
MTITRIVRNPVLCNDLYDALIIDADEAEKLLLKIWLKLQAFDDERSKLDFHPIPSGTPLCIAPWCLTAIVRRN